MVCQAIHQHISENSVWSCMKIEVTGTFKTLPQDTAHQVTYLSSQLIHLLIAEAKDSTLLIPSLSLNMITN